VRWYLRDASSDRDVEALLRERGVWVDHTTVLRWVQRDAPALDKRWRPQLNVTNDASQVDETYIKIRQQWYDLYRAVDSTGATLDFMFSATRDAKTAEQFFRKVLNADRTVTPRVMTVDSACGLSPSVRGPATGRAAPQDVSPQAVHVFE
jgi:transposase, IS6 family